MPRSNACIRKLPLTAIGGQTTEGQDGAQGGGARAAAGAQAKNDGRGDGVNRQASFLKVRSSGAATSQAPASLQRPRPQQVHPGPFCRDRLFPETEPTM